MSTVARQTGALLADKAALRRLLEEQDRHTGFVPDRRMTAARLHELMLADGVNPIECVASREILRAREESAP